MRKAILSLTDLPASKRMTLTLFAACLAGMVALYLGVGVRSAETQTTTTSTPTYYKVQDLGTLVNGYPEPYSVPYGVNDFGHVVGESGWSSSWSGYGEAYAFLYKNGQMEKLGTLGGTNSSARGINDAGQIVGWSDTEPDNPDGAQHAFLYEDGVMKDLGTLGGTSSSAYGINDAGQIVGWSDNSSGERHAFLYEDGVMKDLGTLDEGSRSSASAINNSDNSGQIQIAGAGTYNSIGQTYAFLYDSTNGMKGLGTLGGSYSWANAINTSGQVVGGGAYNSEGHYHAFLYKDGKMNDLGTLSSRENQMSWANGINDFDQVVGYSANDVTSNTAFLYQNGELIDLGTRTHPDSNGIAWNLDAAHGINDKGQIVTEGWWKEANGYTYTYSGLLLTPTSDPPPPADSQAPSAPTISSPQNNTYDLDGSFSVSGSAEAASTVELFEGATSTGKTTKADSSTGAWSIALSEVSEGPHTYSVKATDAAGNISSASDSVTVTVDKTAPKVSSVSPASGATNVARSTDVKATFSEAMNTKTLTKSTFKLYKCASSSDTNCTTQITNVTVTPSSDGLSATLNPYGTTSTLLGKSTKYKVVVTTGSSDLTGNPLAQQEVAYFTTART